MARYIAFLRAINVGGHTVKMDRLRMHFESLGFTAVETFIASGNVVFDSSARNTGSIESKIEDRLQAELGYAVATFVRRAGELAAIAEHKAFPPQALEAAVALNIAFLAQAPDDKAKRRLMALCTPFDDFHAHGREIYWLCRKRQSESTFSNALLEKTLAMDSTLRSASTIRKMAEKYAVSRP